MHYDLAVAIDGSRKGLDEVKKACKEALAPFEDRGDGINLEAKFYSWRLIGCAEASDREDPGAREAAEAFWDDYVEGKGRQRANGRQLPDPRYFLCQYGSREIFAYIRSHGVPQAFVDEDGKWHEARFGALSAVDENSRYLREWKGMVGRLGGSNHVLAMVDCHF